MRNSRFSKTTKILIIFAVLTVAIFFIPIEKKSYHYRSVLQSDALNVEMQNMIILGENEYQNEEFLVRDNKLFLRCQSVQTAVMFTYVHNYEWSKEKLITFRKNHPELEGMWDKGSGAFWVDYANE